MRNQLPSRRHVLCALLPAAGAALLALGGCGDAPGAADESAAPEGSAPREAAAAANGRVVNVEVDTLAPRAFTDAIRLTGTVHADREVMLAAEEGGTVAAVPADKGDTVRRGQALVRLEDDLLRAQRDEAEAQAALDADQWGRRKRLYEVDGIGTEEEYVEARLGADQSKARLDLIEARLRRAVVRAPFDGVIDLRLVEVGSVVAPGQPVARILDLQPLTVTAGVPERYAAKVAPGDRATVAFAALEDTCGATVSYVGAAVDGGQRTFPVELDLERPVAGAKPAMVAEVTLVLEVHPGAIVVPNQALVRTEEGFTAFVAADGVDGPVARARPVTLGASGGDEVVATSGLSEAERLIVVGQEQVADGDRLRIVPRRGL